jgi:ribosomal protein S19
MLDTKTIHYVTQDPMAHLKLRVTLTRLSAAKSKVQQQAQVGTHLRELAATPNMISSI